MRRHSTLRITIAVLALAAAATCAAGGGCTPLGHGSRPVPCSDGSGVYHTVSRGETLWRISKTYGVSLSEIRRANNIDGDVISVGQRLMIPGASTVLRVEPAPGTRRTREDVGDPPETDLSWPLAGRGRGSITSPFGPRRDPVLGTEEFHKGMDIDAAREERVLAAADGEVVYSGRMSGFGTVVMIDHGNRMITLYAHLSRAGVKLEELVTRGQTIGYVGTTGRTTGSHLHFEVRYKGVAVDPLDHLP